MLALPDSFPLLFNTKYTKHFLFCHCYNQRLLVLLLQSVSFLKATTSHYYHSKEPTVPPLLPHIIIIATTSSNHLDLCCVWFMVALVMVDCIKQIYVSVRLIVAATTSLYQPLLS
jgi:hypothetical protein